MLTRTFADEDEARAEQHGWNRMRQAGSDYTASRAVPVRGALTSL